MKQKNQSQISKFRDTARALECDESEEAFDAALDKIAKAKPVDQKRLAKMTDKLARKNR